ncbi:MAG: DUF3817 domain-containing protein [Flavobacteriales bacterium]|nr:DUF3817 domain-containing protein [Flavobacteriales bacterium]
MSNSNLNVFRKVALFEGLSYLILLVLTLNKYLLSGSEMAVKIFGNVHGFLFVLYIIMMFIVGSKYKWDFMMYIIMFLGAILPFGTFVVDSRFLKPLSKK